MGKMGKMKKGTLGGRVVYLNGKYVSEIDAKISIFDSALMFGDMVFEMTRSFNKRQFKLREHLVRLFNGIKILRIHLNHTIDDIEKICLETIEMNEHVFRNDDEHRLMINISRGPLSIYKPIFGGKTDVTVVVADFPLRYTVLGMGSLFDSGINAVIPSQRAIPGYLLDPKIKNRSRIHYQMANIEVSGYKGENNWALLLDPDGFVTEGTGDNFFIVKDGIVITPEGRNILRGISRDYVMNELCPKLKLKCIEKNIGAYDVYTADEAFMTGTPFCMLPVTSLNGNRIGNGSPGKIFGEILSRWGKDVGVDIEKQIKSWNSEKKSEGSTPYQFKR